jgi:hypothetical protein
MSKFDWQEQRIAGKYAKIDLDLPFIHSWLRRYQHESTEYWEEMGRLLQREADDLIAFIRDHRSRDSYYIEIITEYATVCKSCGHYWDGDPTIIEPNCCEQAMRTFGIWDEDE